MPSLISCFGRTQARMNWFVGLVSPSEDHGFGVLHGFRGWVVGHVELNFMVWSHPVPDEELVCQFGQCIRGSRFWCFAWFLWLVVWLVWVVGHVKFDFMFWSHPGPDELVCQFGQFIRGSRLWCFAWFLWLVGLGGWTWCLVDQSFGPPKLVKSVFCASRAADQRFGSGLTDVTEVGCW